MERNLPIFKLINYQHNMPGHGSARIPAHSKLQKRKRTQEGNKEKRGNPQRHMTDVII